MYRSIDSIILQAMLASQSPPILLDVRTPEEFARGRLAHAINIPLNELARRIKEIDPEVETVIYCLSGARSSSACAFLASQNFGRVFNLTGGIAEWSRSGKSVES